MMLESTLDLLQTLGMWSLPHLWLPLAAWTLVALPAYVLLERRRSLHPLVQQRARQALLVALPLGLAAAAVLALVPEAPTGGALPTLLVLPPLPAVAAPAPTGPAPTLHVGLMHAIGLGTLVAGLLALVRIGQLALHAVALRRFRRALPVSSTSDAIAQSCADRLSRHIGTGIRRRVRVVCTDRPVVPMTFGLLRPVIVLPEPLIEDNERLRMTLTHELVHIRRLDYLAHGIERVFAALFAVHPLVGRLHRSAAVWRERACDAAVLEDRHVRPRRYAALLRDLALTPASRQPATLALTEDAHHLKSRLEAMKDYTRSARRLLSPKRTGLLLGTLLLVLATGIVACTELVDANEPAASAAAAIPQTTSNGDVYIAVEEMPDIIGGTQALRDAVEYPELARKAGIEGTVYVQFTVDENGNVINAEIVRGVHEMLDKAALHAVRALEFKPGQQDGEAVKVRMALPITFTLPSEEADTETSIFDEAGIQALKVRIESDGSVRLNGQPVALDELSDKVRRLVSDGEAVRIMLAVAPDAPMSSIPAVLQQLDAAEALRISYVRISSDSKLSSSGTRQPPAPPTQVDDAVLEGPEANLDDTINLDEPPERMPPPPPEPKNRHSGQNYEAVERISVNTSNVPAVIRIQTEPGTSEAIKAEIRKQIQQWGAKRLDPDPRVIVQ